MTSMRKFFVYLVLSGIVAGHAVCIVARKTPVPELYPWPFSNYRMYSGTSSHGSSFVKWEVVGVTGDGREFVLPEKILPRPASISAGLNRTVRRFESDPDAPSNVEEIVRGLGRMYEIQRLRGRHDGAAIEAARLYRRSWERVPEPGLIAWEEGERRMVLHVPLAEDLEERDAPKAEPKEPVWTAEYAPNSRRPLMKEDQE